MIFREICFKNFLVFKGVNRIVFPSPEEHESSLLLVLAPNNAGKTSVIRGLEFLLYGEDGPGALKIEDLINTAYVKGAPFTGSLESWVQAKIDLGGRVATIRRRIEGRRSSAGIHGKVILEQIVHTPKGDVFKADEGRIQRHLSHLVPESLFNFFYFQGESLADQLFRGGGEIPRGLARLLHEDTWTEAIQTVEKVGRKLSSELQSLEAASSEYKRTHAIYERVKDEIRSKQQELENEKAGELAAEAEFKSAEERIKALGGGAGEKKATDELERCRVAQHTEEQKFGRLDAEIATLVAESRGLPFFLRSFSLALKELDSMKHENVLPADVTEGFVSRLLGGDRCICGRPLTPEAQFSAERARIDDYRKRTLAADVSAGLHSLLNRLDRGIEHNFYSQIGQICVHVRRLLEQRDQTIVRQSDLRGHIRWLEEQRANSAVELIAEEQVRQRNAHNRRSKSVAMQKEIESQLRTLHARDSQLRKDLDGMRRIAADPQIAKLHAAHERADQLQALIKQSLVVLKRSFHTLLQRSVQKYYDPKATDSSQAVIDPKTLVPSIRRGGRVLQTPGGGQRQLLVLAHIISLAELRRDLHKQLDDLGIKTGKLDDQSFFLDSIFGPCDPVYARDIAAFLPGKARQMVVLLARQQWYEAIWSELEPHVTKCFVIRLHSNNQERPEQEYVFPFRSKQLGLFAKIPPGDEPYSLVEEVK